jgi:hypothetical protein
MKIREQIHFCYVLFDIDYAFIIIILIIVKVNNRVSLILFLSQFLRLKCLLITLKTMMNFSLSDRIVEMILFIPNFTDITLITNKMITCLIELVYNKK